MFLFQHKWYYAFALFFGVLSGTRFRAAPIHEWIYFSKFFNNKKKQGNRVCVLVKKWTPLSWISFDIIGTFLSFLCLLSVTLWWKVGGDYTHIRTSDYYEQKRRKKTYTHIYIQYAFIVLLYFCSKASYFVVCVRFVVPVINNMCSCCCEWNPIYI